MTSPTRLARELARGGDFCCMNSAGEAVFWSHNRWASAKWRDLARWITQVWLADYDDI
jgi:hypothetical protein